MNIFVTGATSSVGESFLNQLLNTEPKPNIYALINRQDLGSGFKNIVKVVTGGLENFDASVLSGVDVIVHLASITPGNNYTENEYWLTNVFGTKRLIEYAIAHEVKQIIYLSSIVAETDFTDSYSSSKKEAEKLIIESGIKWTIIRPSEIYGKNKNTKDLVSMLRKKRFVFTNKRKKAYFHPVYTDDLTMGIIQSIQNEKAKKQTFTLASSYPIEYTEFLTLMKAHFGFNYTIISIPAFLEKLFPILSPIFGQSFCNKLKLVIDRPSNEFDISEAKKKLSYNPSNIESWIVKLSKLI